MNKKFALLFFLVFIALFLAGYFYLYTEKSLEDENHSTVEGTGKSTSALKIESPPEYHPEISLQAFSNKEFDGRDLVLGPVLDNNTSYTRYYITYKSGELAISGIMNVPKGEGPFPVLILNHGYIDPAVYTNGRGLKREQDYFARRGYVVIHPDYRNHADSTKIEGVDEEFRLGYAEDVINAVYAVRESELGFFDKENIGMLGHSMGGGVALQIMTTRPELVKAISLYAPVSADARDNFEQWTTSRTETAERILQTYGNFEDSPVFWDNISPVNFIDSVEVPVVLHHGTADDDVPYEWSERLSNELKKAGKDITFYTYEAGSHEFINEWPLFMQRNTDFFDEYLK